MIVVTGATGKLGRLVVEGLLEKVPASEIAVAVRTPVKAEDFAARGVSVREADYARPETLTSAFAGAKRVLLISSNEVGVRTAQQKAVVDAAKAAGVELLAYTSVLHADTSKLALAADHLATEEYIKTSGLKYVLLRNGWYMENYTEALAPALAHGAILGSAKDGRVSAATRGDYAAAAVKVLTAGESKPVYELAGDVPFSMPELAEEVSKQSGKQVIYRDLPAAEYAKALEQFGLPRPVAEILADCDEGVSRGELEDHSLDLSLLLGRPTETLASAVAAGLKKLKS
jgi:NAD(P)H dehydrogenase (quinone)